MSCSDGNNQDCQYIATWRTRGDRVEFNIVAQTQGWVGIGFSTNQFMVSCFYKYHYDQLHHFKIVLQPRSDIIVGAANEASFFVDDRFIVYI